MVQLSYSRGSGGHSLLAFARRTESMRFVARYEGRRVSVRGKRSSVTDTDLKGEARKGWEPVRKDGAKRLKRTIRRSLEAKGVAKVRTRAKRDGVVDDRRWRVVLAKCHQEPPLYPVDCEIRRGGRYGRG